MTESKYRAQWVLAVLFTLVPAIPARAEEVDIVVDLWSKAVEMAGYLLIFIVLAALAVHLTKRYQPRWSSPGPIQLMDGRALGPGIGVRLVRVGSKAWLLGVTRERISLLAELGPADLPAVQPTVVPQNTTGGEP
ncbi:MAG: flagellar biosynthetic protein FliO [Magnetococcales bacterium]|nr:flagellar biosynthetic protein FliO [Magnetococcales bacterium]MBF0418561.1 flagellar biosynthetic protein FliO [Magnetococcales bacterium]